MNFLKYILIVNYVACLRDGDHRRIHGGARALRRPWPGRRGDLAIRRECGLPTRPGTVRPWPCCS